MFKIANASVEIASDMEELLTEAFSDKTEDQYKLAVAYLMDAAEYFDLAGMEKEAHITSLILQKIGAPKERFLPYTDDMEERDKFFFGKKERPFNGLEEEPVEPPKQELPKPRPVRGPIDPKFKLPPPEEVDYVQVPEIDPLILKDVFDPNMSRYVPHHPDFKPQKVYDAQEIIKELTPEDKFKSDYIDPSSQEFREHVPPEERFRIKAPKERRDKAPITKDEAHKLFRRHQRLTEFLKGQAQKDAINEYVSSVLYLKSVIDGIPRPDIYTKFGLDHAPQWAADIAQLPKAQLEPLLVKHLLSPLVDKALKSGNFRNFTPKQNTGLTAQVSPHVNGKDWIVELSTGETYDWSTKEKAIDFANSKTDQVTVLNRVLPTARLPWAAGRD